MKIAVLNKTRGGISGGYRKYLLSVIPRLARHPDVEGVLCTSPPGLDIHESLESLPKLHCIDCLPFQVMRHRPEPSLRKALDDFSPDVVFVPLARYIRYNRVPTVVMVQNTWPLVSRLHDRHLGQSLVYAAERFETGVAVQKADHVIVISGYAGELIQKKWQVPEEKLSLIYFGVEAHPGGSEKKPLAIPPEWKGRFLFTAGSIAPFRGLDDILGVFADNAAGDLSTLNLVIAGEARRDMEGYRKKLMQYAETQGISSRVLWAGRLTSDEMAWCYKNCQSFLMMSRFEACPNIALEAMAHGCLIISTENPPMPEFFQDNALYYPAGDTGCLSEVLERALTLDEEERTALADKAQLRSMEFSWDVTAEKTVKILKEAASGREHK
ncbi:MAG: glycosyltransferase [Candidatus Eremiobacteraeota bacterium]|nr:glycosyltransferase [Candidatus Eremiobacteraeota bacterium]